MAQLVETTTHYTTSHVHNAAYSGAIDGWPDDRRSIYSQNVVISKLLRQLTMSKKIILIMHYGSKK